MKFIEDLKTLSTKHLKVYLRSEQRKMFKKGLVMDVIEYDELDRPILGWVSQSDTLLPFTAKALIDNFTNIKNELNSRQSLIS